VHTEATIEPEGATPGSPAWREVVVSRAVVRAALTAPTSAASGALTLAGVVDSFVVRASGRVAGTDSAGAPAAATPRETLLAASVRFRGAVDPRAVRLDPEAGVEVRCTAPAGAATLSALAAARDLFPRLPATLAAGARWRDTVVTATCAGPVLVIVQTESRYEVSGADRAGGVRVVRRSTSTLRGSGSAAGRPVQVAGSGGADWSWQVDPGSGRVAEGSGTGRLRLAVTAGGSTQRFVQRAGTRVVAERR
jgi:hypothetical protein